MRRSHVLAPGLVLALALALVLPGRLAWPARAAVAAWAAAVAGVSAKELRSAAPGDAASLPLVFAAMHVPWGLGFLFGSLRWGPPLAALARIARGR
jgi:succinoglycan biosynthesis protein ExoA